MQNIKLTHFSLITHLLPTSSLADSNEDNAYINLPTFNWPRNSAVHIVLLDQCIYYTLILLQLLGWMDLCKPVTQLCISLSAVETQLILVIVWSWDYFGPLSLLQEHCKKYIYELVPFSCPMWSKMTNDLIGRKLAKLALDYRNYTCMSRVMFPVHMIIHKIYKLVVPGILSHTTTPKAC